MISYAILLAAALYLNARDSRMLALTVLVGAGIFTPVPDAYFYPICMMGETLIALGALRIGAPASRTIFRISVILVACHIGGYILNGYPATSPYYTFVQICEHAELLVCILLSNPFTKRLRHER